MFMFESVRSTAPNCNMTDDGRNDAPHFSNPKQKGDLREMVSKKKPSKKKSQKKTKVLVPQVVKGKGTVAFPVGMDSTSIPEFSIVDDIDYSQKVIDEAESNYEPDKLKRLIKKGDELEVLTEGRRQILELWRGIHGSCLDGNIGDARTKNRFTKF